MKMQNKTGCVCVGGGVRPGSVKVDMNQELVIVKTQKKLVDNLSGGSGPGGGPGPGVSGQGG